MLLAIAAAFQNKAMDVTTAHQQALALLNQTVNTQAAVLSYADIFRFVALVFFCCLPLLFFLGKGAGKNAQTAH